MLTAYVLRPQYLWNLTNWEEKICFGSQLSSQPFGDWRQHCYPSFFQQKCYHLVLKYASQLETGESHQLENVIIIAFLHHEDIMIEEN